MPREAKPHPIRPTVTRYLDAQGRRCAKGAPGARKRTEQTDTYYADLPRPEGGRPERVTLGTTDEGRAWVALRELLERRAGGGMSDDIAHGSRPILEHVEDWRAGLVAGQLTADYVATRVKRCQRVVALAGWSKLSDITLSTATAALGKVLAERMACTRLDKATASPTTRNHYHGALRQFLLWCVADDRLPKYPLAKLEMLGTAVDRRHDRRCPDDAEMATLFGHLAKAKVRVGMSGPTRALGYQVSMATGFRADEVRSLAVAAFDLVGRSVVLGAAVDKRRRAVKAPLPVWLCEALTPFLAPLPPRSQPWDAFGPWHPGRALRLDLKACGVAYERDGLFFDFHALRVWYISALAHQPGIDPRTLMELARHSKPSLTLGIYAKARPERARAAVDLLPAPVGCSVGCSSPPAVAVHRWTDGEDGGWGPCNQ